MTNKTQLIENEDPFGPFDGEGSGAGEEGTTPNHTNPANGGAEGEGGQDEESSTEHGFPPISTNHSSGSRNGTAIVIESTSAGPAVIPVPSPAPTSVTSSSASPGGGSAPSTTARGVGGSDVEHTTGAEQAETTDSPEATSSANGEPGPVGGSTTDLQQGGLGGVPENGRVEAGEQGGEDGNGGAGELRDKVLSLIHI